MYSSCYCLTKTFVLYCGTIIVTELSECAFRIFLKKYKKTMKPEKSEQYVCPNLTTKAMAK